MVETAGFFQPSIGYNQHRCLCLSTLVDVDTTFGMPGMFEALAQRLNIPALMLTPPFWFWERETKQA